MRLSTAIYRAANEGKSTKIWRGSRGFYIDAPRPAAPEERIAWEVVREDNEILLYHWGTLLVTAKKHDDKWELMFLDPDLGWGSVSDQTGYNEFFSCLQMPYRMDRDKRGGGPRITELV